VCYEKSPYSKRVSLLREKTEVFLAASKEIGLEVNTENTKYIYSCLVNRLQNEVRTYRQAIHRFKAWPSSDISEQL